MKVAHPIWSLRIAPLQVEAFGFYIAPADLDTHTAAKTLSVPYHYWEVDARDDAAAVPSKPWTFASHNYPLESKRLRDMAASCLLQMHGPEPAF